MSIQLKGGASSDLLSVNSDKEALVSLTKTASKAGYAGLACVGDDGTIMGSKNVIPVEATDDFQLRVSKDDIVDAEIFNYGAQNTAKFISRNTTLTNAWAGGFMTTNSGSITTINTGSLFHTYKHYKMIGSMSSYLEFKAAFTGTWAVTNTNIDFGAFLANTSTPYAPTDGIYFRVNNTGIFGVTNNNGSEQTTSVFSFTPELGQTYKFAITISERDVIFWIDDVQYGILYCPVGVGQISAPSSFPIAVRHAIGGTAASAVTSMKVASYALSVGGLDMNSPYGTKMNKMFGSYEGLSGGTMGSLASYANSANPAPAVPTNTTSTVLNGLGGQGWETDTLAITTDGIICSYQNPAASVAFSGRNLVIHGIKIDSYVQTALTGGGYNAQICLAFGHTAVSLATAEAATTKAPRRIPIGSYSVAAGAVALSQLPKLELKLNCPIVLAPGEFIQVVKKKVGTAPSAGVMAHLISFDYYFE